MNEQSPRPRNTINAVKRALDVLLLFTTSDSAYLGVSQIAGQLRISKAVVYRMLSTLRAAGLVEFDEATRRYSLGPTALALADAYLARIDICDLAQAPMRRLSDLTAETATLSILTGRSRVYIGQEAPARELKMTVPLGHPFPLHAGSSSKAFLAFLSEADREKYLTAGELPALTERTVTNQASAAARAYRDPRPRVCGVIRRAAARRRIGSGPHLQPAGRACRGDERMRSRGAVQGVSRAGGDFAADGDICSVPAARLPVPVERSGRPGPYADAGARHRRLGARA